MDYPRSWKIRPGVPGAHIKPREGRPWYVIGNRAGDTADVYIYDEIGYFGVTAADFARDLTQVTAPRINLRISSPGGEVFDAIAIYEAIRRHPAHVTTHVDGLAASAASFIALAGDRRLIARNATMMVHEAHGLCIGNTADMREMAALLDRTSANIADIYAQRAGGTVAEWRKRMKAETWLSAKESVELGLMHEVTQHDDQPAEQGEFAALVRGLLDTEDGRKRANDARGELLLAQLRISTTGRK